MFTFPAKPSVEFGHFTLLFCRGRQRNVLKFKTHVQRAERLVLLIEPIVLWRFHCRCRCRCLKANLLRNNVAITSSDCLMTVLPPPRTTNFHVAKSRNIVYFLQHARGGGITGNKQSQLATATLLRDKLKENVACITWN